MKKALLLSLGFVLIAAIGFSQTNKYWSAHNDMSGKITTDKAVARQSFPKMFKLFDLNTNLLSQDLFSIVGNQTSKHSTIISLPNAEGGIEEFEVFEASNFEPALQALFPSIRAYSGKGITDKYSTLKLSISPQGIQAMIFRTDKVNEFIEPYSKNHSIYAAFKSQRTKGNLPWTCSTDDKKLVTDLNLQGSTTGRPESSDGTLKTMRLAQSCNGEYSTFFGAAQTGTTLADTNIVLAAFNATLTRCNGVYEKDLALHLNLIPESRFVIFFNPATDPYTTLGAWNGQLQATLTAVIGEANYDIGHMFGASGGGGNAGCIGCVCNSGKGSGITSPADGIPQGDNFDIDYVVHEVGHQLGGNHTYSHVNEGTGVNKEVGSGITIMGYAGITNQDVAPHSIDIFHQASIQQIQSNLATKTCPITTNITANNATPVVAPVTNRTIPLSTPFILTGSATDANAGDILTYCWEQNDNSTTTGNNSVASPTKLTGPNWLSFSPTTNTSRTCPILPTILAGNFITGPLPGGDAIANIEALSSVARTLNFRLTVRDNSPYVSSGAGIKVGQTAFTDMTVTVDGTSGPFQVTTPNTNLTWFAGSAQTVTWSVNNTTAAPVSCANVKISLSTDGGLTFPTVLAASTPNDGSELLNMPATLTTTARIKVEAVGNIFFDISNTNFILATPPTDFNFGTITAGTATTCPAAATIVGNIATTQTGGFANLITLAATPATIPAGTTISFGTNPVAPGSSSTITLNNANTLAAGSYSITVTGSATGASTKTTTVVFNVPVGTAPVLTTNSVATAVCAPNQASFSVVSSTPGVSYQWQSAPTVGGTYTNVTTGTGGTTASYSTVPTTAVMNGMGYRCVVSTQCGTITSANALLTVNTAAAITTQPTAQAACTGTNATFNVTATGTGVSYQWQSSTTGTAGSFTNVGTNSSSYTITGVTAATPTFYQVIVSTTTCAATVTSTVAQLTITASVNTTNPVSTAVCVGATANFSVTATGAGLTYQWQSAPTAAGTFTNVSTGTGGTTASYTTAVTTVGMSGSVYRVIVTGTCLPATTTTAGTLTVNTAAAVTTNPIDSTVCSGITAGFTGSGTGTGVTYQWQQSASAAGPWVSVTGGTGATTGTYTTPVTTPTTPITYYRLAVITTTCPSTVYTTAAKLTVNTQAIINTQPTLPAAVCVTSTNVLTVNASYASNYQWQVSTAATPTFTNILGATSASYTIALPTVAMSGNKYRVQVFSTCTPGVPTNSVELTLVVTPPVAVTQNPVATSGCINVDRSFSVTATGATNYQWQFATSATGTYTDIPGATSATYTVVNPSLVVNGYYYRVIVSSINGLGTCSSVTTPGAQLLVSVKPVLVLTQAATSNTNAAVNSTLTTTVSPVGNYTYNWKRNGASIANTLASTFITLNVDDAAIYIVTVTDPTTGCASDATADATKITSALTSDNLQNDKVFIYPNPVSSIMYVRFNTSTSASRGTTLNVYDEKGAKVFAKAYDIVNSNGRMAVDMSGLALGTYMVYIMDASGKKLGAAKVVKVQ
jgi:hypothetical protein